MTNPSNAPTDSGTAAPAPDDQALTDAGKLLGYATAVEYDDAASVDAAISKALSDVGAADFGTVVGVALTTVVVDILGPLLIKADSAGMKATTALLVAASGAGVTADSGSDTGSAA